MYGIVKQHGGHVAAYSEPGYGALFRVYFPRHGESVAPTMQPVETMKPPPLGGETILVVEDQDQVLALTVDVLQRGGYTVLAASGTQAAMAASEAHAGAIHLLVSDVVLADGNGRTLYEKLAGERPSLRVLFMSGYTADVISHHGVLREGVHFIQKPFSPVAFTRKVRDVIDGAGP